MHPDRRINSSTVVLQVLITGRLGNTERSERVVQDTVIVELRGIFGRKIWRQLA